MNWVGLLLVLGGLGAPSADGRFVAHIEAPRGARPTVVWAKRSGAMAALRIQLHAGTYHDREAQGLTRLTQLAILESVPEGEGLEAAAFAFDAELSVTLTPGRTGFALTAHAGDFAKLATRLMRTVFDAPITEAGLARAKTRMRQEPEFGDDAGAALFAHTVAGGYLGNRPSGNEERVSTYHLPKVQAHRARYFRPGNATLIFAGQFSKKPMQTFVRSLSGGDRQPALDRRSDLAGVYFQQSGYEFHMIAYPVALTGPEDVAALHLGAAILNEQLQRRLRAAGLVYSVNAAPLVTDWLEAIVVMLPLGASSRPPAVSAAEGIVTRLAKNGVTAAELERNRSYLLKTWRALDREPEALARALGQGRSEGGAVLAIYRPPVVDAVRDLDADALMDRVHRWLSKPRVIHAQFSRQAPPRKRTAP